MLLVLALASSLRAQEVFPSTHTGILVISPELDPDGKGWGLGIFRADRERGEAHYRISIANATDPITQIHLRRRLPDGEIITMGTLPFPSGKATVEGVITILNEDTFDALDAGLIFLDIGSEHHPEQFMTGKIEAIPTARVVDISPRKELHEIPFSEGWGHGYITLDRAARTARYTLFWGGLTDSVVGIYFHEGGSHEDGEIAHAVSRDPLGDSGQIMGTWEKMSDRDINALLENRIYVNFYTENYPLDGEIRGTFNPVTMLTTTISHTLPVPQPSGTDANGTGFLFMTIDSTALTLRSVAVVAETSSPIRTVHLHQGAPGENGPILITYQGIGGFWLLDMTVPVTNIPAAVLEQIRKGNVYIDFHTDAHQDGEARGNFTSSASSGVAAVPAAPRQTATAPTMRAAMDGGALRFTLDGAPAGTDRKIILYSALGARLAESAVREDRADIETSGLPSGMYVAQLVVDGKGMEAVQVIIAR